MVIASEEKQRDDEEESHGRERESESENVKEKTERETETGLSTPGCLSGHATCTLHLGFIPHWDFRLL